MFLSPSKHPSEKNQQSNKRDYSEIDENHFQHDFYSAMLDLDDDLEDQDEEVDEDEDDVHTLNSNTASQTLSATSPENGENNSESPRKKHARTRTKVSPYQLTEAQLQAKVRIDIVEANENQAIVELEEAQKRLQLAQARLAEAKSYKLLVARQVSDILLEEPCFWNMKYQELKEYKRQYGHCRVTRDATGKLCSQNDQIRKLGVWVGLQRRIYRQNPKQIRSDRIFLLNELGFDWDPIETMWNEKFEQLKQFKEKYGHTNVSNHGGANKELVKWVRRQQSMYKNRSSVEQHDNIDQAQSSKDSDRSLSDARMKQLQSIGFEWDSFQTDFDAGFEQLLAFKKEYEHPHVARNYKLNPSLSIWVKDVRKAYRNYKEGNRRTCLNTERIQRLQKIGFCWTESDGQWNAQFHMLQKYKIRYGNFSDVNKNDSRLRSWLSEQRRYFRIWKANGCNPDEAVRFDALEKVGVNLGQGPFDLQPT